MLPDLYAHHIERLTISFHSGTLRTGVEPVLLEIQSLGGELVEDDSSTAVLSTTYAASNRYHLATLAVSVHEQGIGVSLHSLLGPRTRRRLTPDEAIGNTIEYLKQHQITGPARVQIAFSLPKRLFKTIVPIPLTIFQPGSGPFERLLGFRLGGRESDQNVIVEVIGNRLNMLLTFHESFTVDQTLPDRTIETAKHLVTHLLLNSSEVEKWLKISK